MAVDVKIELTGLALCFKKIPPQGTEEVWNIAFLCDRHHPLDLRINGAPPPSSWRPPEDIFLDVVHTGEDECGDTNFRKLLNISNDEYGHGRSIADPKFSNLTIHRDPDITTLVWMQIPRSMLSVSGSEDTKIVKTHPEHGVPKKVKNRGKKVILKFAVPSGLQLAVRSFATGNPIPGFPPINPSAVNGKIDIVFQNACNGTGCTRNDFVDLYEFVVHMDGRNEVRYITWAEDAETEIIVPTGEGEENELQDSHLQDRLDRGWDVVQKGDQGIEIQKTRFKEMLNAKLASPYGNCDPVGSEPPPGP